MRRKPLSPRTEGRKRYRRNDVAVTNGDIRLIGYQSHLRLIFHVESNGCCATEPLFAQRASHHECANSKDACDADEIENPNERERKIILPNFRTFAIQSHNRLMSSKLHSPNFRRLANPDLRSRVRKRQHFESMRGDCLGTGIALRKSKAVTRPAGRDPQMVSRGALKRNGLSVPAISRIVARAIRENWIARTLMKAPERGS
jgi:hypothetical protein